mmetsp:Transcript_22531/g.48114  ORF Transcript_22531/g.48114 Transcript_22531/m.48114 type:complete len:277 (-) Transcript_22531:69-899(-)
MASMNKDEMIAYAKAEVARNPAMAEVYAEYLKEDSTAASSTKPKKRATLWEIVGGEEKGGVVVKAGMEMDSAAHPDRLAFGAKVAEVELVGDRLNYRLVRGNGPQEGWISIVISKKAMAKVLEGAEAQALDEEALEIGAEIEEEREALEFLRAQEEQEEKGAAVPDMDSLLAGIDNEDAKDDEANLSLEEMLAKIDADEVEEKEVEDSRNMFFSLAAENEQQLIARTRLPTQEELQDKVDSLHNFGKFSFSSFKEMGAAILKESRRQAAERGEVVP